MKAIRVIDSHTGGEPTRVILNAPPHFYGETIADKLEKLRTDFDWVRTACLYEPRGNDVLVGALVVEPSAEDSLCGVIFFNSVGYLGMCGHGLIGVMETLQHQGRLGYGRVRIETPVGTVEAEANSDGTMSVQNVPAYRKEKDVKVELADGRIITGDIAWGGNWFFLSEDHGAEITYANREKLTELAWEIRRKVNETYPEVDHIELFGKPTALNANSKNFVLCPGGAYDRSPCGTGTSAKLACLYADGKLAEGDVWVQESIIGSLFEGTVVAKDENEVIPTIKGQAHIIADAVLFMNEDDPFAHGIGA